ncbi:hypothetical protein F8135_09165 [Pseudomonas aeruginosa]|nr:hypothetical protein D0Y56_22040 [Pseudomonas aeruginosa]ESR70389.1 hypothetical protein T266_15890 [Pseudomonas aeruginosa VRFPA05]KAB5452516.1 hypothetical protein F8135_09165 [Pseudomonas aeruginosa]KSB94101.2 hypothetical protein AO879_30550 [Pseudomonas aeruginosa]KSB94669.2 hypothetical protein AO880_30315 [Pseudomonas aeruginosa]
MPARPDRARVTIALVVLVHLHRETIAEAPLPWRYRKQCPGGKPRHRAGREATPPLGPEVVDASTRLALHEKKAPSPCMSDAMSKNKHPDLGEIQRSLNQALEGYDCQCRMHYDGTISINVAAREHDETFTFVGIQPGELDNPTRLHLFAESLRRDLALLEPWLGKHAA